MAAESSGGERRRRRQRRQQQWPHRRRQPPSVTGRAGADGRPHGARCQCTLCVQERSREEPGAQQLRFSSGIAGVPPMPRYEPSPAAKAAAAERERASRAAEAGSKKDDDSGTALAWFIGLPIAAVVLLFIAGHYFG